MIFCTEKEMNIDALTNGNMYSFRVRAVNDAGCSEWSLPVVDVVPVPRERKKRERKKREEGERKVRDGVSGSFVSFY